MVKVRRRFQIDFVANTVPAWVIQFAPMTMDSVIPVQVSPGVGYTINSSGSTNPVNWSELIYPFYNRGVVNACKITVRDMQFILSGGSGNSSTLRQVLVPSQKTDFASMTSALFEDMALAPYAKNKFQLDPTRYNTFKHYMGTAKLLGLTKKFWLDDQLQSSTSVTGLTAPGRQWWWYYYRGTTDNTTNTNNTGSITVWFTYYVRAWDRKTTIVD